MWTPPASKAIIIQLSDYVRIRGRYPATLNEIRSVGHSMACRLLYMQTRGVMQS